LSTLGAVIAADGAAINRRRQSAQPAAISALSFAIFSCCPARFPIEEMLDSFEMPRLNSRSTSATALGGRSLRSARRERFTLAVLRSPSS
jgi:hypothetical protein